jgi:SAM-dependent methyltransferase
MDSRAGAAKFYDLNPNFPDDVPFYLRRIRGPGARVLELGCGTGHVSIPLALNGAAVHGIDRSPAMIEILRSRLSTVAFESGGSVTTGVADIADFEVGRTFDFIIAPFRVFQNLDTDREIEGLFRCVRRHLDPAGRCILNTFHPNRPPERMRLEWSSNDENLSWRIKHATGTHACFDRRTRTDEERLVLYPDLIYRRYDGDRVIEEHTLSIAMRCHYPDDFVALVERHGFRVFGGWGGYADEPWGAGPELVLEFGPAQDA